jgi:hypothetical protein
VFRAITKETIHHDHSGGMMPKSEVALIVAASLVISFAAVAQDGLPRIDTQKLCRDRGASIAEMMGTKSVDPQVFDSCVKSEQDARDALVTAWKDIPASFKGACIKPGVYSPSYAEWISCLELNIDVKNLRSKK